MEPLEPEYRLILFGETNPMMQQTKRFVVLILLMPLWSFAEQPAKRSPKEGLRALNDLIGSWRASGTPTGTREEQQRGFWTETQSWSWQFKGDDAWLKADFEKGKYFSKGELHYVPEKDLYAFTVTTPAKDSLIFEGKLKDNVLTFEREDQKKRETQRLVMTLLHGTRLLYRYEVKGLKKGLFSKVYNIGATKEGVAFAGPDDGKPECVVSGGLGTRKVSFKGQTYYVCCSGCQDAFKDNPEKYIKEFEERKAKEAKIKDK
jgi:hypothetical protein